MLLRHFDVVVDGNFESQVDPMRAWKERTQRQRERPAPRWRSGPTGLEDPDAPPEDGPRMRYMVVSTGSRKP